MAAIFGDNGGCYSNGGRRKAIQIREVKSGHTEAKANKTPSSQPT